MKLMQANWLPFGGPWLGEIAEDGQLFGWIVFGELFAVSMPPVVLVVFVSPRGSACVFLRLRDGSPDWWLHSSSHKLVQIPSKTHANLWALHPGLSRSTPHQFSIQIQGRIPINLRESMHTYSRRHRPGQDPWRKEAAARPEMSTHIFTFHNNMPNEKKRWSTCCSAYFTSNFNCKLQVYNFTFKFTHLRRILQLPILLQLIHDWNGLQIQLVFYILDV